MRGAIGAALLVLLLATPACDLGRPDVSRVVLVTLDTTRADRIGCYGYDRAATPNLDALAEEGVLFESAVSQVPTTLPSHSTIFTGLYPQDHGVRYNIQFRLGPEALTLAEVLKGAGFATAAFPASFILGEKYGLKQGFERWEEPPNPRGAGASAGLDLLRTAGEGVDLALDWLSGQEGRAFLWLHFYDPHAPYAPPFPYSSEFRDRLYDGEIAYTDAQLGRLLDELRASPAWDETLVVVVGDHGEGLYEHEERYHGSLIYETTQHVPLIIRPPRARPSRVAEPVSLADIMPTVLDLAGISPPDASRGASLRPALEGRELPRRDQYFESLAGSLNYGWAELRGIRYGQWKLIDSADPELFDLSQDPAESANLASLEADRVLELREALRRLEEPITGQAAALDAEEAVLDPETEAFLASLGYVGGGAGGSAENALHPREIIDMESELLGAQQAVAARNWPRVVELARYVLGRDPSNKWALNNIVQALIHLDRGREAQDAAAELLELYPTSENSFVKLASAYEAQGLHQTAYEVLEEGLRVSPDSPLLTYLWLLEGFEAGEPSVCATDILNVLAVHPGTWQILVLRSRCEVRAGRPEKALGTLEEAVKNGFQQLEPLGELEEFREVVRLPGFQRLLERSTSEKSEAEGDGETTP